MKIIILMEMYSNVAGQHVNFVMGQVIQIIIYVKNVRMVIFQLLIIIM